MTLSILYKEMMSAGRRLSNALQIERHFDSLFSDWRTDDVLVQLKQARRLVDSSAEDYGSATQRYRKALSRCARSRAPDR